MVMGSWNGGHVNFQNGAGTFPFSLSLFHATGGHVHINFPVGPEFYIFSLCFLQHGGPRPY